MAVSRRSFLVRGLIGGAVAIPMGLGARFAQKRIAGAERALEEGSTLEAIAAEPPGALSAAELDALAATAETVIGFPIEIAHYREYFGWKAARSPGYAGLYRRFVSALAGQLHVEPARIAGCAVADRRDAVGRIAPEPAWARLAYRWRVALSKSALDGYLFRKFIVGEVLALFASTDAHVLLGYRAWPGTARGYAELDVNPPKRP